MLFPNTTTNVLCVRSHPVRYVTNSHHELNLSRTESITNSFLELKCRFLSENALPSCICSHDDSDDRVRDNIYESLSRTHITSSYILVSVGECTTVVHLLTRRLWWCSSSWQHIWVIVTNSYHELIYIYRQSTIVVHSLTRRLWWCSSSWHIQRSHCRELMLRTHIYRFLSDNALSLCIRSHEVPTTLRGFEERHDRRLLTVCCWVLQYVAARCSVLQRVAVCCSVMLRGFAERHDRRLLTVCCSAPQCVAVCCRVLQCGPVLQCAAMCCSVLQCAAVCCSVLQCAAVCCIVL